MQKEKVTFGIKNIHVALMTDSGQGKFTCEVPEPIQGCQEIKIEVNGDKTIVYADNEVWYVINEGTSMKVDLLFARILDDMRFKYMGAKKDTNGGVYTIDNPEDIRHALFFEIETDLKPNKYVLLNGVFGKEKLESKTKEDKTEVNKIALSAEYYGVSIGEHHVTQVKIPPEDTRYATLYSTEFVIPEKLESGVAPAKLKNEPTTHA